MFMNWINQHLSKAEHSRKVSDLYNDLQDGLVLIELMKTVVPNSLKFVK